MVFTQAFCLQIVGVDEVEGGGIDAIAQTSGSGAVLEAMAEVAAVEGAVDFGADHAVAAVDGGADVFRGDGFPEARPSRARVEFMDGAEQRNLSSRQNVEPWFLVIVVGVAKRRFGAVRAHYMILLGCQHVPPFCLAALDFEIAADFCPRRQGAGAGFIVGIAGRRIVGHGKSVNKSERAEQAGEDDQLTVESEFHYGRI